MKLNGALRSIPWSMRFVRWRVNAVRKGAKKLGAGLAPLEHRLDDLDGFLEWLREHRGSRLRLPVTLMRESARYDEFHELVLDLSARKERLTRVSSTFTPLQRGRYRPAVRALVGLERPLTKLDEALGYIVHHPDEVAKQLERRFAFASGVDAGGRRIRYRFDPSGAMLFGDGMEYLNERIFELGPRRFSKLVKDFMSAALSDSPPEAVERFDGNVRIDISSVSGAEQSKKTKRGVVLSINALSFLGALKAQDPNGVRNLLGATRENVAPDHTERRVLSEIHTHAINGLEQIWKTRSLGQEYAGVLSIERLELPGHTGSFPDSDTFASYAEHRVEGGMRSYFARNVGLHIAWTLVCDRFGQYRPITTASIRELSGRSKGSALMRKIISEMEGTDATGLIARYIKACERLTRAPIISKV